VILRPFCLAIILAAAASSATTLTRPAAAQTAIAESLPHHCAGPVELTRLDHPLARIGRKIAAREDVKIVAIGSSSTAGAGASTPAQSYPSQLAEELQRMFPRQRIVVVNRGINGEEARDMLARFDRDVIAENPDLVLWQVGTNAVLRDSPLVPAGALIHEGLGRLKHAGADVVLIDPQFAPKVLAKKEAEEMVEMIATAAKKENVDLFRRFAVMRHWLRTENIPFSAFLSPDELHMNDWGYGCIAKLIAGTIAENVRRSSIAITATAR
jgi:lysophospholipase L1-like esterase